MLPCDSKKQYARQRKMFQNEIELCATQVDIGVLVHRIRHSPMHEYQAHRHVSVHWLE